MKRVALLLSVLAFSVNAFGASIPAEVPVKVLQNQIVRLLDEPSMTIYKETKVQLKFMVTKNGKLDVVSSKSENEKLAEYVKKRLDDKNLAIYVENSKEVYSVVLRFIV
ncbi:hypothetical protein [Spongiivirga citrea]|uniref:TonB C-terminal domain-containing protein n=1 Tax=Spongiivirga citrea TaxID=1481457 RepID=A0A6M0CM37_9FLAO|nr:hypothetical protein [Spongiivirga citrea]NER17094.1 hypothetical protein [Spongiivirga citrea]